MPKTRFNPDFDTPAPDLETPPAALQKRSLVLSMMERTPWESRARRVCRVGLWGMYKCSACGWYYLIAHGNIVRCWHCIDKWDVTLEVNPTCRHCFGRGYRGVHPADGEPLPCSCAKAVLKYQPKVATC